MVSGDEVMAHPVVPVRPVPQSRGPEVRIHSVPVVEVVVSGRIRTGRDVYHAVPLAARIRSLQQIANDLFTDALLPEMGDRLRVELEPDLARIEEDQDRLIRDIALCQQCQVFHGDFWTMRGRGRSREDQAEQYPEDRSSHRAFHCTSVRSVPVLHGYRPGEALQVVARGAGHELGRWP